MTNPVSHLEVDLDRVLWNWQAVSRYVAPASVIPVIKGNAYGHGAVPIARTLTAAGCRVLAVGRPAEARELIRAGVPPAAVIVMGDLLPEEMAETVRLGAAVFIGDLGTLARLGELRLPARFHLKVDTGMGRIGFLPDQAAAVAEALARLPGCSLEGFATHLCAPWDRDQSELQQQRFQAFLHAVGRTGVPAHVASSSAVAGFRHLIMDAVRVGDLIYGLCGIDDPPFELRPIMSFRSRVTGIKQLPAGWHVGYGTGRKVTHPVKTATVPIGSTDGMMTSQAGRAFLLVNGKRCPLLAVCADTSILGVGHLPAVEVGDEVVYIGTRDGETITARDQAEWAGTGFSELLSKISLRVPRIYTRDGRRVGEMSLDRREGVAAPGP